MVLGSKYNDWDLTSWSSKHSNVTWEELIFLIVIVISMPLGKVKGNSNFWPTFKFSLSQFAIISKVPSVCALSKLKSDISTTGGTLLATSGLDILGKSPIFIISSVRKGFNKDSSVGNPAIDSEPAISIEATDWAE